ncbi:hypothetical protein J7T55_000101, partial [Diaporthe amygdali]|uniref:uncharacterized protein n=1 Tax=Phomopsis amygdali TaxID=1214568 RepID=UPI0022FED67F
ITCYRAPQQSVSISIIPRPNADENLKKRLRHFGHRFNAELDQDKLAQTFQEADLAMGIRKSKGDNGNDLIAFSEDILKIEICGPDSSMFPVYFVFQPQSMVKAYMDNRRTIILAVLPCNVDIQTQEVIKLAKTADPDGIRTMGVLTKPDLAFEKTTQEAVIELVNGKHDFLKLGYFVVKNRGADDNVSTISARLDEEKVFFTDPAWVTVQNRCGIDPLRRLYLSKLASKFQMITLSALDGHYMRDEIFRNEPNLKLATRMVKLNETFADIFWQKGHKRAFGPAQNDEGERSLSRSTD